MTTLFSFDYHGTLRFSLVPGPITVDMLHNIEEDHIIVASSFMTYPMVVELRRKGIEVEGGTWKRPSVMRSFKESHSADEYIHVGNSPIDKKIANRAGFKYWTPGEFVSWYNKKYGV